MISACLAGLAFLVFTWSRGIPDDPSGPAPYAALQRRVISRLRARKQQELHEAAAIELIAALSAELTAGLPAGLALERAAASVSADVCPHAVGTARLGGDVARALRTDAKERGLPVLRLLAALWQVADDSGAGLAQAARRLAAAQATSQTIRRELAAQLAGPRATAKVLAGLPALGLLLGSGLGADPLGWLLGTPLGWGVLVAGCLLELAGILWTRRITRGVEQML